MHAYAECMYHDINYVMGTHMWHSKSVGHISHTTCAEVTRADCGWSWVAQLFIEKLGAPIDTCTIKQAQTVLPTLKY